MKKLFFLSFAALLAFSCKEEQVQTWDDLTEAQRQEARERASKKCFAEMKSAYNSFKSTSSSDVFRSTDYNRGKGFYSELKEGESVKRKVDIRVWKRDPSVREVYFYITEDTMGTQSFFLRITEAENDAMIEQLYQNHCLKEYVVDDITAKVSTTIRDDGPVRMTNTYDIPNSPNIDKHTDAYQMPFSRLAYFGNFTLNRTVKKVKASDVDSTVSTVSYKSSLQNKNYEFESDIFDAKRTATQYYFTQKFCKVAQLGTTPAYHLSPSGTNFGYALECENTKPADWNLAL